MALTLNHAVGETVQVRTWDSMLKEFGLNLLGNIDCTYSFSQDMKIYCGEQFVILFRDNDSYRLEGLEEWTFTDEMLEDFIPS